MSAFTVVYQRSNTSGDPGVFHKVMERLGQRGPDGCDVLALGAVTLGHWHFWTTPEEVGERQPLALDHLPFIIVLDGRIDNRAELISQLEVDPADASRLSDAALILKAYQRWAKACFERFIGEFALVIFDKDKHELVCARDQLGDRTLFFSSNATRFVIASEPWAVLGAEGDRLELNQGTLAHFFATQVPEEGQTFFAGVSELPPAHAMVVNASGHTISRYWQPDLSRQIRFKTEKEYSERFLALLEESVRCRMRAATPVGVSMSGGLDSTSLACLAARMLAPQPLTTISDVYDELPECDEREYIDAVQAKWGLNSIQIPCDGNWTFKDWEHWPCNPNQPEGNVYRLNLERNYQRARAEGLRVLFTGEAGDPLYLAGEEWLADLLMEGRLGTAWSGLKLQTRLKGWRYFIEAGHIHSTLRVLLRRFAPWLLIAIRRRKITNSAWLRPLTGQFPGKNKAQIVQEFTRHNTLLGPFYAYTCSRENINASRHGIELRYPYRDRRLVEFMIGIPAYLLHFGGLYKHILRMAMQDILPENIRTRKKTTQLSPLFYRGVEREHKVLRRHLYGGDHFWEQFVDPSWLLERLSGFSAARSQEAGAELFVAWLCASFERWQLSFIKSK